MCPRRKCSESFRWLRVEMQSRGFVHLRIPAGCEPPTPFRRASDFTFADSDNPSRIFTVALKLVLSSFGCGRVFMDDLKHVRRGRKGEYMSPRRRSSESFSRRCLPRTYLVLNNHVWRFRPSMSISVSIRIPICSLRLYFSERIFRKRRSELRARQSTDPVAIPMRTATPVLAWRWHGLTPTILFIKSKSTKSTARASYELVGASNPSRTQEVERGH